MQLCSVRQEFVGWKAVRRQDPATELRNGTGRMAAGLIRVPPGCR